MSDESIRAAFRVQADWNRRLGAGFTARVCDALAAALDGTTATGRRILGWAGDPFADAMVLRLTGGFNALVRAGDLPGLARLYPPTATSDDAALGSALAAALHDDRLLPWLDSAPQTNEVARSGVLMPGLLTIAAETGLPLALFELGASAGLNLRLDDYRYTLGGADFGRADASLHFAPVWEGPPPPAAEVRVVARRGVDLNPLDPADPAQRARLLAYVWPEQAERVQRLETALACAAADPAPIDRADAADWAETHVAPVEGRATVVFHSIAFQYFPHRTQARIAAHMATQGALATATAPLAWLRYEMEQADASAPPTLRLTLWPDGADRRLAHAHPHGASVRWLAA